MHIVEYTVYKNNLELASFKKLEDAKNYVDLLTKQGESNLRIHFYTLLD